VEKEGKRRGGKEKKGRKRKRKERGVERGA